MIFDEVLSNLSEVVGMESYDDSPMTELDEMNAEIMAMIALESTLDDIEAYTVLDFVENAECTNSLLALREVSLDSSFDKDPAKIYEGFGIESEIAMEAAKDVLARKAYTAVAAIKALIATCIKWLKSLFGVAVASKKVFTSLSKKGKDMKKQLNKKLGSNKIDSEKLKRELPEYSSSSKGLEAVASLYKKHTGLISKIRTTSGQFMESEEFDVCEDIFMEAVGNMRDAFKNMKTNSNKRRSSSKNKNGNNKKADEAKKKAEEEAKKKADEAKKKAEEARKKTEAEDKKRAEEIAKKKAEAAAKNKTSSSGAGSGGGSGPGPRGGNNGNTVEENLDVIFDSTDKLKSKAESIKEEIKDISDLYDRTDTTEKSGTEVINHLISALTVLENIKTTRYIGNVDDVGKTINKSIKELEKSKREIDKQYKDNMNISTKYKAQLNAAITLLNTIHSAAKSEVKMIVKVADDLLTTSKGVLAAIY